MLFTSPGRLMQVGEGRNSSVTSSGNSDDILPVFLILATGETGAPEFDRGNHTDREGVRDIREATSEDQTNRNSE